MEITITQPHIKQAIDLVVSRCGDEKRILSPTPGHEPYWHHLVRVYTVLVNCGEQDDDILIASILHDAIEDGHTTYEGVLNLFNVRVAQIVSLMSESTHTDHTFSGNRDYYFERMAAHPDPDIRQAAMKIKTADRYDNLLGISYTDLEAKKAQFLSEIEKYLMYFAQEVGMAALLQEGMEVLAGLREAPDLSIELNYNRLPLR